MSVSIITMPPITESQESLVSANNPSIFTVGSDDSSMTDYRYVADVYVNGVKSVTLKTYPDPAFGFNIGVFDLNSIANKYVSYDLFPRFDDNLTPIKLAPNSSCQIQLKFRDEFVSGSTFIASSATTDSPIFSYLNSSLAFADATDDSEHESLNSYFLASDQTGFPLIEPLPFVFPEVPKNFRRANYQTRQWLYYFGYSGVTYYVHIHTYDILGNELGHYRITDGNDGVTSVRYVQTGLQQLANLDFSTYTVVSGADTIIIDGIASYTVGITNDSGEASSFIPYTIVPECTKFSDTYTVYWLNVLGGFDSFRFAKRNVTTITKNQVSFKKVQGAVNNDAGFTRLSSDPSMINFYTEYTTAIQLNSDWLSDFEVLLLKDLFTSPVIFVQDSISVIQSATVADNSYPINKIINGQKAYSLQLNLNLSSSSYRQLQ